jgi:hypothetical protein
MGNKDILSAINTRKRLYRMARMRCRLYAETYCVLALDHGEDVEDQEDRTRRKVAQVNG